MAGGAPEPRPAAGPWIQSAPARRRSIHFDRIVLACGAVGLAVGLGFIVVGQTSGPKTYALAGALYILLMALPVVTSPWLPLGFARSSAFKIACFICFIALFLIFWMPVWGFVSQDFYDTIMHSIPTHSPAIPSPH